MGHIICHKVLERDVDKAEVLDEIREEVLHEDWQEGGRYHGNLRWHEDTVYVGIDKAEEAIDRLTGREAYVDCAVLFRDVEAVPATAKVRSIDARIARVQAAMQSFESAHSIHARKSRTVSCPRCESRIAVGYMRGRSERCPVCGADLRAKSTIERLAEFERRLRDLERERAVELKKGAGKAPVRWLLKYEYHV